LHIPLTHFIIDPFDITTWHAFLLFRSWCLSFSPHGDEKGHQETRAYLHQYMVGDWETLQEEHTNKT
jgi:hypothetical protein